MPTLVIHYIALVYMKYRVLHTCREGAIDNDKKYIIYELKNSIF